MIILSRASTPSLKDSGLEAALNQAVKDIQAMLRPLLDAFTSGVNPKMSPFAAKHTGLDAVFDTLSTHITPGANGTSTVTAMNRLYGGAGEASAMPGGIEGGLIQTSPVVSVDPSGI